MHDIVLWIQLTQPCLDREHCAATRDPEGEYNSSPKASLGSRLASRVHMVTTALPKA